jgi:nucleotide-binding universal stress UspA family protein
MTDIVIGMDTSAGAAAALRWAVREAEVRDWTVTALLAWGLPDQHHALPDEWFDPGYTEADALDVLDSAIEKAVGTRPRCKIERRLTCDLPAGALVTAADDARLLVVGARGLGGFQRLLLGSVSEQCLRHAPCAVAVVHADAPERPAGPAGPAGPERIVVGIDGSADGRRALGWALDEARARGAALHLVHAWQAPFLAGYPLDPLVIGTEIFEERARTVMENALDGTDLAGLAQPVQRTLVCNTPAAAILDAAKDADLVVVGSRGIAGFRGLLIGSVSHQVACHSPCPVLVVRSRQEAGGGQPSLRNIFSTTSRGYPAASASSGWVMQ